MGAGATRPRIAQAAFTERRLRATTDELRDKIYIACADPGGGGARGPWPPPTKYCSPNSEARAKRALAPPYKILDPPMHRYI